MNKDDAIALAESCLLHARYCGLLPAWVDVQFVMRSLWRTVAEWSDEQRAAARAWCEPIHVDVDVAPSHVMALVEQAQRDVGRAA